MRTGPTNENMRILIDQLRKKTFSENIPLWKRIATDLEKPTRQRRVVNLANINRNSKEGETVIVPGKVLADGELNHSLTICAWKFSAQALDKIEKSKSKALSIEEFINNDIKGKKVRILG